MTLRSLLAVSAAAAFVVVPARLVERQARDSRFLLSCSTFPAGLTENDLQAKFGAGVVTNGPVTDPTGAEGDEVEGTILYAPSPEWRLELSWKDALRKRRPALVRHYRAIASQKNGPWHADSGITTGTDLQTIEKYNGRPFRIAGFGFDGQGGVSSWSGGTLEALRTKGCEVGLRLIPVPPAFAANSRGVDEVNGDRIFSSAHPAMQALNPVVIEMVIQYE